VRGHDVLRCGVESENLCVTLFGEGEDRAVLYFEELE